MKRALRNLIGLGLVIVGDWVKEMGHRTTEPEKVRDLLCHEMLPRGGRGPEHLWHRRYCRLAAAHVSKHKDGDFEWGEGETNRLTPLPEDDGGQGEGCEGGKCAVRT